MSQSRENLPGVCSFWRLLKQNGFLPFPYFPLFPFLPFMVIQLTSSPSSGEVADNLLLVVKVFPPIAWRMLEVLDVLSYFFGFNKEEACVFPLHLVDGIENSA